MRLFQLVLLCALTTMLYGCIYDSNANSSSNVKFTIGSTGTQIGITGQQMRVISGAEQLALLLSEISISGDVPNPDFSSASMVALFSGSNSGCSDGLTVTGVEDNGETLIIKARMSVPGAETACPAFVPNDRPYVFIELATASKPISLLVSKTTF